MALFQLNNHHLSVKVNSYGAELSSVISNDNGIEYIWQADSSIWARHAPHLFPIVGKLKNGTFNYQSHDYQLPQHGFARDNEFLCIKSTTDSILFELLSNKTTKLNYPFDFKLQVEFKLLEDKLETIYTVFNSDSSDLYFSIGAHPAFNYPLQDNESEDEYDLVFPGKHSLLLHTLKDGLITHQTKTLQLRNSQLQLSKQLFENDALVCSGGQIEEVSLLSRKTKHGVSLTSKKWPFFGIWSKKDSGNFVCLEPWFGIADFETASGHLAEKTGIIKLVSGQQFNTSFQLHFF